MWSQCLSANLWHQAGGANERLCLMIMCAQKCFKLSIFSQYKDKAWKLVSQLFNYIKPMTSTECLYRITTTWLWKLGDKNDSSQSDVQALCQDCLTTWKGSSRMNSMTLENNWHFQSDRSGLNNQVVITAGSPVSLFRRVQKPSSPQPSDHRSSSHLSLLEQWLRVPGCWMLVSTWQQPRAPTNTTN